MTQSKIIQLPAPLHGQLKALAAARGKTMVEVIADTVRQAVEAGEIAPETSGLSLRIEFDADAPNNPGPFIIIQTPAGDLPPMTRDDAETVAGFLLREGSGEGVRQVREHAGKRWSVEARGTSLKLIGKPAGKNAEPLTVTLAPVVARGLARQMQKVAPSAV